MVVRLLLAAAVLLALILGGRQLGGLVPALSAYLDGLGAWAPLAFIVVYMVATVAFVPGSLLTLAAGAMFGLVRGTLFVMIGATLGASGAFLVARHLARGMVERRLAASPRFAALDTALGREGRRIVVLLRLSPVFPFNMLNYTLGVTKVSFLDFFVASAGMLPGSLLYVYYGRVAGDVAALAGGVAPPRGPAYYALLAVGLLATIAVTIVVTRAARRALAATTKGTLE
jgi:uncharacterized membrane protein YdjX (TVP38/TMEM64 family)